MIAPVLVTFFMDRIESTWHKPLQNAIANRVCLIQGHTALYESWEIPVSCTESELNEDFMSQSNNNKD